MVNLRWALDIVRREVAGVPQGKRADAAFAVADWLAEEDVATNAAIAENGTAPSRRLSGERRGRPVNIYPLQHWPESPASTGGRRWASSTARTMPAFRACLGRRDAAAQRGRQPDDMGTCGHGVPHTPIADNAGGHLMQHGKVDLCLVGADRITAGGDAGNKIGTYLKALAAVDNNVPFYVAALRTIDWTLRWVRCDRDRGTRARRGDAYLRGAGRRNAARVRLAPRSRAPRTWPST